MSPHLSLSSGGLEGAARRGLPAGLVSVPTTRPRCNSAITTAAAHHMREGLSASRPSGAAFVPPAEAGRLARLRRSVGFAARAHTHERPGFRPDTVLMITATYREADSWKPEHVSDWLHRMRKWANRRRIAFRYVWVAELTKAGRVHYHVALWVPAGVFVPASDAEGWWPHGSTRTERARAVVPYLMKYLTKGSASRKLPKGARMHGAGGQEHSLKRAARWLRLPGFVRARSDVYDDWRPAPGGGWSDPEGFCVPSEYQRVWLGDAFGLIRVADYGRPFQAAGPFTWLSRRPA